MAVYNKFNSFVEAVAEKVHNLGSDTLTLALSNTAPAAANAVLADITQIAYTNLASSRAITITSSAQASGTYKLVGNDVVLTATGAVATFRYVVLYNDTATNDELIGWWDYGVGGVTLANTDTFTVDLDQSGGILTIT